ncbi:hypothetical protein JCM5350_007315 [Sporobolomyces pararoseus]
MASTTSNPASTGLGECVVCGKESTTACSACKKAGLDWMYFCSKEHQKLIWKVHKRVCGKNSFEWPPLSEKEVEEGWIWRNLPVAPEDSPETLMENFLRRNSEWSVARSLARGESRDEVYKAALEGLKTNTGTTSKQETLKRHRTMVVFTRLSAVEQSGGSKLATLDLFSQDPIGFTSWLITEQEIELQLKNVEWTSDLQHRILIFFTLVALEIEGFFNTGKDYDLESDLHIKHSKSVVLNLGRGGISNVGPVRAQQAVENLVERILRGAKMTTVRV